jgi:hypothetical protein
MNFHGYYSANPSGRLQKDVEVVKDSRGPFPFDDLLSNIKEIRGGATSITSSPHNEGSRGRSSAEVRPALSLHPLYGALPERSV